MIFEDPYHALGLYRNPFISEEIDELIETTWIDRGLSQPPSIKAKLFIQLRGAEGTGKTSHLLYWLRQTGGVYVTYRAKQWQIPPVADIVYWDEAQAIPLPLLLFGLCQGATKQSTIVVATHTDLSWVARSFGLKVKTIVVPILDLNTLLLWAEQRIQTAKLPNAKKVKLNLTQSILEEILVKSENSWRAAAVYLHIWVAKEAGL
jgi:hypothetical protein